MPNHQKPILLVALGGNALIRKGQTGTAAEQLENLRLPAHQFAELSKEYRLVITHGNGPQVGNLLLQQEACQEVPKQPLEILVAQTQGQIGYMLESTLDEQLMDMGVNFKLLVTLITYVVVDKDDPAFRNPTKPIGPCYTEKEAERVPYPTMETPKGFRRVVASPEPVTVVEKREIQKLLEMDFIVICCGGGGIPVIRNDRKYDGIDAVIDKDLASALLAKEIGADLFIIATDVEGVMLHFGRPEQQLLRSLTPSQANLYRQQNHFKTGSMGPKVDAAVRFVEATGKRSIITSTENILESIKGNAGTHFLHDDEQST